jgi:hypothetical protein
LKLNFLRNKSIKEDLPLPEGPQTIILKLILGPFLSGSLAESASSCMFSMDTDFSKSNILN